MKQIFCPRCGSRDIHLLADGIYKCNNCGYAGDLNMEKKIFKD